MTPALQLIDVHEGTAPPWWPPAPGWWLLLVVVLVAAGAWAWQRARNRRREASIMRLFDDAVANAPTPAQQVAAMAELLRRAARRKDAGSDALAGDDWLRFLDAGMPQPAFTAGAGRLILEGGYRPEVAEADADALRQVARQRYRRWMLGK